MFVIYLHIKFHILSSNSPLVIAIKMKDKHFAQPPYCWFPCYTKLP